MTLEEFRLSKELSFDSLTALLGLSGAHASRTVRRYALHERMPRVVMLRRIAEVTGGAVTANDFLADPPPSPRARRATPAVTTDQASN